MVSQSLSFKVRRCKPELIRPAKQTPRELKKLSDVDDQQWLRFHLPMILIFKHEESMQGRDPVRVIREGIAQALVYYYPFAGRLREAVEEEGKLVVDCTGEGVIFIEADADVSLDQFGDAIYPPFPCLEELLFDVPGSSGVLDSPLLLFQVTRLKDESFILAIRLNHTMADGLGIQHFMKSVAEMARGAAAPSTLPVWDRHLLNARVPPQVTCKIRQYDRVEETPCTTISSTTISDDLALRSFFFGSAEISAMRNHIPPHSASYSTFEVLSACVWQCHTRATNPVDPNKEIRFFFAVDTRSKYSPPLPDGYYGNAFALPAAVTTAGKLCSNSLGFAMELIREAKEEVTEEYMHSLADLMVVKGRPHFNLFGNYTVSDVTQFKARDVDFGWGEAVYCGPVCTTVTGSHYLSGKNRDGEKGIVLLMMLPPPEMEVFVEAMSNILNGKETGTTHKRFIQSSI